MRTQAFLATCVLSALASCASSSEQRHAEQRHPEHITSELHGPHGARAQPALSHDVFFTLSDESETTIAGLIAACESLRAIPGVVHLTTGRRDLQQTREMNETSFHVALHVEFVDQAAYDGYGPHPVHQALVTEYGPKFASVLVYDALLP